MRAICSLAAVNTCRRFSSGAPIITRTRSPGLMFISDRILRTREIKSIVAAIDIPQGTIVTADMLTVKKPGHGLAPARLSEIIGRRAVRAIRADTLLALEDFAAS